MKRIFDLILSLILLLVFSPLFPVIMLMIYLSDPGPVFFLQKRVGRKGKLFNIVKFRTMKRQVGEEGFQPGDRSRIFPAGAFLRKSKLDELPQLWNVVKGEMSLVGPRPEVEKWTLIYPRRWEVVLQVKPGITDNASIAFRHEERILAESGDPEQTYRDEILPGKLDLYEAYVRDHNLLVDMRILLRTFFSIFKSDER